MEYKHQGYGLTKKKFEELTGTWHVKLAEAVRDFNWRHAVRWWR